MKNIIRKSNSNDLLRAPAFPRTGPQIFESLRTALTEVFGFQLSFERLARILGRTTNVTHYWFKVFSHTHLIAFLALMERLPERRRLELLNELCRELPGLDNPRLSHDLLAVSNLGKLLRQTNGATLIRGGSEFHRGYILQALGHSLPRIAGQRAHVGGLDVHEPAKWVPLETVNYLRGPLSPARTREAIVNIWPEIESSRPGLLLLNSVWSSAPHLHGDILKMTRDHHLVLADSRLPEPAELAGKVEGPIHVITVAPAREHERWIRIEVEAI